MTTEEKLQTIAEVYVDLLLARIKNPDADFRELNECVRTLHFFGKMGLIRFSMPEYSRERPEFHLQACPIQASR